MTPALKPYPAYKDSGVSWLGQVPAHWRILHQRNVAHLLVSSVDKVADEGEQPVRLCNYVDVYKNERITGQLAFMRASASAQEVSRFRLAMGDVLITKDLKNGVTLETGHRPPGRHPRPRPRRTTQAVRRGVAWGHP